MAAIYHRLTTQEVREREGEAERQGEKGKARKEGREGGREGRRRELKPSVCACEQQERKTTTN